MTSCQPAPPECTGSGDFSLRMFLASATGLTGPKTCPECRRYYDHRVELLTNRLATLAATTGIIGSFAGWWGFTIPEKAWPITIIFSLGLGALVLMFFLANRPSVRNGNPTG